MKTKKILLYLFVFLSIGLFAQQKNDLNNKIDSTKNVPKEVLEYFDFLTSYSSPLAMKNDINTMPIDRLKHLASIIYKAKEKDAVSTARNLVKYSKMSDSLRLLKYKYHRNVPAFPKPTYTRKLVFDRVKKEISNIDYALISTDYLLKVIIKSIKKVKYHFKVGRLNQTLPKVDINVVINDVIKGNTRFNIGDTLTFYYLPIWALRTWNFNEGDTCIVPLIVTSGTGNYDWLALDFNLDITLSEGVIDLPIEVNSNASFGRYPIVNGKLIDRNNFFGYGTKVPWDIFKIKVLQQINYIKSW